MFQVKLNPSLADAWLCLGNCIWKKGDLASAKNCFSLALNKVIFNIIFFLNGLFLTLLFFPLRNLAEVSWSHDCLFMASFSFHFSLILGVIQGPNKKILCQLSMLERKLAQGKALILFRLKIILDQSPVLNLTFDVFPFSSLYKRKRKSWLLEAMFLASYCNLERIQI